ncbi:carboxyltransferase domain-containing protein [Epibacterium sp. SM1979]|uniref:Carboxyltransferase domain-containing protein n=1 Tax=Tritonibacter litoralis TaxID=2662264 RepID=A0A843YMS6_9RHOB|nr:carboxyltransferase domain-containing protein [Tritonibacter litoralis]MQQ10532.1 carboxyltransferase domain-containing protein [Tritonibacter litoralis]
MRNDDQADYPQIRTVGLSGLIISFSNRLEDAYNRAALALRAAVSDAAIPGVLETSTSLASVYVRFDSQQSTHAALTAQLSQLLADRDWTQAPLPKGRRFWRVPTVYGGDLAPQLAEAADLAGMSEQAAIDALGAARVRVLTIGFAPGQPYLGPLGPEWNIPRQTALTPMVPRGALVQAVSQFVLFTASTPTGWRHVGQTGLHGFQPTSDTPFTLRAGDEMQFFPVSKAEFLRLCEQDPNLGGAQVSEVEA